MEEALANNRFQHPEFDVYGFNEIPSTQNCFLVDESDIPQFEAESLKAYSDEPSDIYSLSVGWVSVKSTSDTVLELAWYPDFYTRYHEVQVSIKRSDFLCCVGSANYDTRPHIFLRHGVLDEMYLHNYALFCMIDAVGMKNLMKAGELSRSKLIDLRARIDRVAGDHPEIAFISFADNVLLKTNWKPGHFESGQQCTYRPEAVFDVIKQIGDAFMNALGTSVYAVLTQGSNEYSQDSPLHISSTNNHIGLNSLGLPFSHLLSIDKEARQAIREDRHGKYDLYIDDTLFRSIRFATGFNRDGLTQGMYTHEQRTYWCASFDQIKDNIVAE